MFKVVPSKPEFSVSEDSEIKFNKTGTILSPYTDRDGYKRVSNTDKDGKYYIAVHRAVAEVYVPNPNPEKFNIVNHLNGIKDDNRPSNLEWTDSSKNRQHCILSGRNGVIGESHPQAKLDADKVELVCRLLSLGLTQKSISEVVGVSRPNISYIKSGKIWREVTETFDWFSVPPRKETFSSSTVDWVKDQISRGYSDDKILEMAVTLDKKILGKIRTLIERSAETRV